MVWDERASAALVHR